MELSWDWLRPLMRVPYVPTLGPVHPDALTPELLADVVTVAGTARILPYDTDHRWSVLKDEHLLVRDVEQTPGRIVIPTVSTWGRGELKVHWLGDEPADVEELLRLARRLAAREDVDRTAVVWCTPDEPQSQSQSQPEVTVTRLQLKTLRPGADEPVEGVEDLRRLPDPVRARFEVFADQTAADGFALLWRRFQADAVTGPILTVVSGDRIVGAIGPMETMKDSAGQVRLLPLTFSVLPEQRRQGHGRRLWRAAMNWARANGAEYQLLQTELGTPADALGQAEGLRTLGFVHTARG